jgi:N-acetylmuramic acid 6-phosphate etherase
MDLDRMPLADALQLMNTQNAVAVAAVASQRDAVAKAVEIVSERLKSGGRLIYVGAGTSGRLGVLDASECPPTFGTDPQIIQGMLAGGNEAMFRAREGAEDNSLDGAASMDAKSIGPKDVVLGIAAGGTTPFVRGAVERASSRKAATIFLCCVPHHPSEPTADLYIRPLVGPEILTGSTRLKAGTATKLVLNQITTLAMVKLGKVYENLMVDVRVTNQKLRDRAVRIVQTISGLSREDSMKLLESAHGEVKPALVMHARKLDFTAARELLKSNPPLREVIGAKTDTANN